MRFTHFTYLLLVLSTLFIRSFGILNVEGAEKKQPTCSQLLRNATTQLLSRNHKIFTPGEWVLLTGPAFKSIRSRAKTAHAQGILAEIISINTEHSIAKLRLVALSKNIQTITPLSALNKLSSPNSNEDFAEILKIFQDIKLEMSPGDTIAYRNPTNGKILLGKLLSIDNDMAEIQPLDDSNLILKVNQHELSIPSGPIHPSTISIYPTSLQKEPVIFSQRLIAFFNGARKLTSLRNFKNCSFENKLKIVVKYINLFVTRENSIAYDYSNQPPQNMISTGSGACLQKAYYTTNILREAGFDAEIRIVYWHNKFKFGHAWSTAHSPSRQTYFIDPGKSLPVLTPEQARLTAEQSITYEPVHYYLYPDFEIFNAD